MCLSEKSPTLIGLFFKKKKMYQAYVYEFARTCRLDHSTLFVYNCVCVCTRDAEKEKIVRAYEHIDPTGWRRLIGSPKLQIIFHKRASKYRSLLQTTTHKDKGSYESSPPCTLGEDQFSKLQSPRKQSKSHTSPLVSLTESIGDWDRNAQQL